MCSLFTPACFPHPGPSCTNPTVRGTCPLPPALRSVSPRRPHPKYQVRVSVPFFQRASPDVRLAAAPGHLAETVGGAPPPPANASCQSVWDPYLMARARYFASLVAAQSIRSGSATRVTAS